MYIFHYSSFVLQGLNDPRKDAGPKASGNEEALGKLEEKKSKLADRLEDRKSKLGNCPNLFAANFKAARGVAAKGWESSSQSQEEAETGKQQQQQERIKKPVVEKNQAKRVRRNLFGKHQSFQNVKVQEAMQQKKRELGEHQRRKEGDCLRECSNDSLTCDKNASPSKLVQSKFKPKDESTMVVFPASPTKSVRQSQVSAWVTTAQQALPSLAPSKASPKNNIALRSRSPRRRLKSSTGNQQEVSKWVAYQRVRAGRRPGTQQGNIGKEGKRLRDNRKQAEKPFDLFKEQNQCSFFDSIETNKGKGEGPLDFLFADGDNNEEPQVTGRI